ncbi:MAG: hypothetical protein OIF50_08455 [Flavobacteriaceae bacterium]|nr:hypothetical protein [Flavobacteriaceae bacterium]
MKTFLTIFALVTFVFTATAKDNKEVKLPKMKIEKVTTENGKEVVRVHKNKNYKVIKALNFTTKKSSLMA